MTDIVSKECQGMFSEPEYGFWSLKKEISLMYWTWPFLQIAKQYFDSFYYLDLFAGSGLMKADSYFFVGSPIVAIGSSLSDKKFSQYICFETDNARKIALEKRADIASKYFGTCKPVIINKDCNIAIDQVLEAYCPSEKACFLAFVDPQGITDLKWSTLQKLLSHCKGDLILNFPTSGIIRNLAVPESKNALTSFFGDETWAEIDRNPDAIVKHFINHISSIRVEGHPRVLIICLFLMSIIIGFMI
jgi:three-Cys-motif partner protein